MQCPRLLELVLSIWFVFVESLLGLALYAMNYGLLQQKERIAHLLGHFYLSAGNLFSFRHLIPDA